MSDFAVTLTMILMIGGFIYAYCRAFSEDVTFGALCIAFPIIIPFYMVIRMDKNWIGIVMVMLGWAIVALSS